MQSKKWNATLTFAPVTALNLIARLQRSASVMACFVPRWWVTGLVAGISEVYGLCLPSLVTHLHSGITSLSVHPARVNDFCRFCGWTVYTALGITWLEFDECWTHNSGPFFCLCTIINPVKRWSSHSDCNSNWTYHTAPGCKSNSCNIMLL